MSRLAILISIVVSLVAIAPPAKATPEREFIMSCTYGVLAGTLVGAATLAFSSSPGNNLQNVARGASIGLYVGIALGYYTAYMLPKQLDKEQENMINNETGQHKSSRPQVFPTLVADGSPQVGGPGLGLHWEF